MVLRPDFDSAGPGDLQLSLPADVWYATITDVNRTCELFHSVVVRVLPSDTFYESGFLQATQSE